MVPSRIHAHRTRTTKKHKGQQLLNDVILYSLTTLACTSFCSSPLWYPPFCATFNVFFFFSIPKITSFFFTSKALFIMGNLIVLFLLGESKFFASKSKAYKEVSHDKNKCKPISPSLEQMATRVSNDGLEQEKQVTIFGSKTCNEVDQEEFFELCNDDETCESGVFFGKGYPSQLSKTIADKFKTGKTCSIEIIHQWSYESGVDNMTGSFDYEEEDLSCSEQDVKAVDEEKNDGLEGGDEEVNLPTEELNKLVDDFIARIIRQRRLEA